MKKALVSFFTVGVIWEVFIAGSILPGILPITTTFFSLSTSLNFLENIFISLFRLISGWSSGMLLGTAIGIAIAINQNAKGYAMPIVSALFPIPKIALLPLFVVIFGLGESGKISTIMIGAFFPSIITAYSAVIRTPKLYVEASKSCGANYWFTVRKIILPYNLPSIIQGFRTSASISLTLLVAAEMLGSQQGIGYWILVTGGDLRFAEMFTGIIWLSIIGLTVNWAVEFLRKTVCYWSTITES